MAMPSSSSSFTYAFTYHVFLSFRGKDTRYGFTGNLYKALRDKGIHTFMDDPELRKGDQITPALEEAIQKSRIFLIVLSPNYASSSFCLNELAHILNFNKEKGLLVLPVFHNVDPSDVRYHKGIFGEALVNHERRVNTEKLKEWKDALHEVANLSGYHFKTGDEYEYKFTQEIVELVSSKINHVPLPMVDHLVGLESQMLEVKKLLDIRSNEVVHMVGIYGLGGIGKSTLAVAIYNSIADHFESLCFLENVRENSNKYGLQHLQSNILSDLVGEDIKLTSVRRGSSIIQHRLQQKKVLLILDDVDKKDQLEAIVGEPNWFGPGSRIIITSRDKQLLACHGVERMYEVKELNQEDALQLLCWKAFKKENFDPCYHDVLNQAVTYASGLPLALEVIGSNLYERSIEEWKSAINGYQKIPDKTIQKILKVSYDALQEDEQNVFLDIACCFKGYALAKVEDILQAHHGNSMKYHIRRLVDKSLINISWLGVVTLHDLVEDMGKELVRKESPREPGKRSRLWFYDDIIQVLKENEGSCHTEIVFMDFPLIDKEVKWDGVAFKKMTKLKTLIIMNCLFSKSPVHLPNTLRVLIWRGYPSKKLPCDFHSDKLAICELSGSSLPSPELVALFKMKFVNLRSLNFDMCTYLTEIPNVSGLSNLEELSFSNCDNLITIHSSVGLLEKLKILDSSCCSMLKSFPPIKLISLEELKLSGCSSLERFPEILEKIENISDLSLDGTPIREFPHSFHKFSGMETLELSNLGNPTKLSGFCNADILIQNILMMPELYSIQAKEWDGLVLPKYDEGAEKVTLTLRDLYHRCKEVSSKVQCLHLEHCNLTDEFFPLFLPYFANVKELLLPENNFKVIPECIKQCHFLEKLALDRCYDLEEIKGIPPNLKLFSAKLCGSLKSSCRSMLLTQELHEAGDTLFYLPETEIPEWFEWQSRRPSISFWFRNKFPALVICLHVVPDFVEDLYVDARVMLTINDIKQHWGKWWTRNTCTFYLQGSKMQHNLDEAFSENEWNHAEFELKGWHCTPPPCVRWGIHVLKEQSCKEDTQFTNPYRKTKLDDDDVNNSESQDQRIKLFTDWEGPGIGWVKCNMYVSYDGSCGAVFRDCDGEWLNGFQSNLGKTSDGIIMAELRGINIALETAWKMDIRRLCIEMTYNKTMKLSQLITNGCDTSHPAWPLIQDIKNWQQLRWTIRFSHCWEGYIDNLVAQCLANNMHKICEGGIVFLASPPPYV